MSLGSGVVVRQCTHMPARKGYDNHHLSLKKNPQTENQAGRPLEWNEWVDGVMPERDVLRILGFQKDRVKIRQSKEEVYFWGGFDQIRSLWGSTGRDKLRSSALQDVPCGGGQHSMVSTGPYDLSLSPCVAKGWRLKAINLFVSGTIESACIIIIIIHDNKKLHFVVRFLLEQCT